MLWQDKIDMMQDKIEGGLDFVLIWMDHDKLAQLFFVLERDKAFTLKSIKLLSNFIELHIFFKKILSVFLNISEQNVLIFYSYSFLKRYRNNSKKKVIS